MTLSYCELVNFFVSLSLIVSTCGSINKDSTCHMSVIHDGNYSMYHLIKPTAQPGNIYLKFSVEAPSDVHVLFTESPTHEKSDPVYEIGLGEKNNTFSELRRLIKSDAKAEFKNKTLLSALEPREFTVKITQEGVIEVKHEKTVLLYWKDPNPIRVRYFSFSTAPGINGNFRYNCDDQEEIKDDDPTLSPEERIIRNLLENTDAVSEPIAYDGTKLKVTIFMETKRISLNAQTSEFYLTGSAIVDWDDYRFNWQPEDYNDTYEVSIDAYQLWKPQIFLFNALEKKYLKPFKGDRITVMNYGSILWKVSVEIHAICDLNFENWPWDDHICSVQLGTLSPNVYLGYGYTGYLMNRRLDMASEWIIATEKEVTISPEILQFLQIEVQYTDTSDSPPELTDVLIAVKRKTCFYHNLFYYLFIGVSALLLMSIFMDSLGPRKLIMNFLCFFFLLIMLLITANSLPEVTQKTPMIVMAYSIMSMVISIYVAAVVILMQISRMEHTSLPPNFIVRFLDSPLSEVVLFLSVKSEKSKTLKEKTNLDGDPRSDLRRKYAAYWLKFAAAVDRILFIIVVFFVILLIPTFTAHEEVIYDESSIYLIED